MLLTIKQHYLFNQYTIFKLHKSLQGLFSKIGFFIVQTYVYWLQLKALISTFPFLHGSMLKHLANRSYLM